MCARAIAIATVECLVLMCVCVCVYSSWACNMHSNIQRYSIGFFWFPLSICCAFPKQKFPKCAFSMWNPFVAYWLLLLYMLNLYCSIETMRCSNGKLKENLACGILQDVFKKSGFSNIRFFLLSLFWIYKFDIAVQRF